MKYQEYTKSRKDNTKSEMKGAATEGVVPVTQQMRRKSSLSDSDIPQLEEHFKFNNPKEGANTITEKFKAFNLGNLMKSGVGGAKFDVATETKKTTYFPNRNNSGTTSDEDPIGPVVINRYSSNESYSSYSSSGSSDEEDEEESDEENLTLAFQSKVAPLSRANFLSLTGRAKSHESNLPTLGSNRNNNNSNNGGGSSNGSHYGFQTPIIFHDGLPEFEDVPDGLIGEDSSDNSTPTGYGYYDNSSIPPVISTNVSTTTLTTDMNKSPSVETKLVVPTALQDNAVKISSPLNPRSAASAATIRQPLYKERKKSLRENICNNQFNNHYKKGPVYSPFPNAKHLDNDEELIVKESENKFLLNRPSFFRSNSVTVGLLLRHGAGSEFDVGAAADDKKEEQLKE
jgi:[calcium/calmodulin-dependent protein kinase] kinase